MKRILSFLLALLLLSSFASCGGETADPAPGTGAPLTEASDTTGAPETVKTPETVKETETAAPGTEAPD
ncbi:MAG: hypothetical protein IJR89_07415, partial [Clostridia bacterium]|nr:hypothetical protein [Clostridia bacterium]